MTVFINSYTNKKNGNGIYLLDVIKNIKDKNDINIITLNCDNLDKNFKIHKINYKIQKKSNLISKLLEIFLLSFLILKNIKSLKNQKIVFTSDPPMIGILLIVFKNLLKLELVFWCQDIFPDTFIMSSQIKKKIFFFLICLNKFILNNCDKIITISVSMQKTLTAEYHIKKNKIKIIHNWPTIKKKINKKKINKENKKINISYIGNIGRVHAEINAINFIKKIKNKDIDFKIYTQSNKLDKYKSDILINKIIKNYYLDNVNFVKYLNHSDIQMMFQKEKSLKFVMPSKLYNILLFKKPILYFLEHGDDEISRLIKKYKIGLKISKNNFNKILLLFANTDFIANLIKESNKGYKNLSFVNLLRQKSIKEWINLI